MMEDRLCEHNCMSQHIACVFPLSSKLHVVLPPPPKIPSAFYTEALQTVQVHKISRWMIERICASKACRYKSHER